jgi:hypothetical protein
MSWYCTEHTVEFFLHNSVFQLDFEIFRTIASFIKFSSGHSSVIKLIVYKVLQDKFRNRWVNSLRTVPSWITVIYSIFNFLYSVCPIVLFLLAIVLSVLSFMTSDYPFGIFKLFLPILSPLTAPPCGGSISFV